jgi:3-hydroxyisobutyrate dehydrogenase
MSETITRVGYIGLGIMGRPMAGHLLAAGLEVLVWNRTRSKAAELEAAGAGFVESPAAMAARRPQVIFLNVTDTPDVEAVLFGEQGVCAGAEPGLIVVDHSTISPVATRQFAARLAESGVCLLDAPVSGGDVGARAATLSIMVGGPAAEFARVKPLLEIVGKSITHLGPVGAGQTCKACNQTAIAGALLGVCEALALARREGLELDKLIQVLSGGAAGSWQLANLGPRIAAGDHAPGFMIDLMLKDLAIVADTARELKLPLNGVNLAESYFRAVAAGEAEGGRLGTQAMARTVEKLGGFSYTTERVAGD